MKADSIKQRFTEVYNAQSDAIFRYCLFRISNYDSATDLTADTFMKFWDALSKGKDIQNDRAFIFMIVRNLVIDFYRKKKTISLDAILEENEEHSFMASGDFLKEEVDMTSEARFVMDKIKELPPADHQIIYLRFVEDLKPKEIAEILGVSANVVSVRIIRGIEKLRRIAGYGIEVKDQ